MVKWENLIFFAPIIIGVLLLGTLTTAMTNQYQTTSDLRMSGKMKCSDAIGYFRDEVRGQRNTTIDNCKQMNSSLKLCLVNEVSNNCCHAFPKCMPFTCDAIIEQYYLLCEDG